MGGYCEENNLQPAQPDHDRVLRSRETSQFCRDHKDIVYAVPGNNYCLRHTPPDRKVWAGNSRVESNTDSKEDVGLF